MEITERNNRTFIKLFRTVMFDASAESKAVVGADSLIQKGIILVDNSGRVLEEIPDSLARILISEVGVDNITWSKSFHKDWDVVANSSIEQLVLQQYIHYFSTYGMEALGFKAMPVIPVEAVLSDPEGRPSNKAITVIRVVDAKFAEEMFKDYLKKTKNTNAMLMSEIVELTKSVEIDPADIMSFELKVVKYDQLDAVPENAQDFLRFLLYKMTRNVMLVKDRRTIETIKNCAANNEDVARYFTRANLEKLSESFYRFKPLFLAFKTNNTCRPIINRIRRLAEENHKPVSGLTASNLVNLIKAGKTDAVTNVLEKASNRDLVKLINFSKFYIHNTGEKPIYNIRNGKVFINEDFRVQNKLTYVSLNMMCTALLSKNLAGKFDGKSFYIPDYISYAVPVSEKQMIGNIPYGTTVTANTNSEFLTTAIYWENQNGQRVDIDLHMQALDGTAYGWNSNYRSDDKYSLLYSGDMTDSALGAVEAYRYNLANDNTLLLSASNFTGLPNTEFKFFMTNSFATTHGSCRAPINVEDALFTPIPLKFAGNDRGISIGYIEGDTFTFYGGNLTHDIVPKHDFYTEALKSIKYRTFEITTIEGIIAMGGGRIINEKDYKKSFTVDEAGNTVANPNVVDLSPSALTARTLFDLVD